MRTLLVATLVALPLLAGCLTGDVDDGSTGTPVGSGTTSVFERHELDFIIDDGWSHTLQEGVYEILPGVGHFLDVELPLTEAGGAATGAKAHLGLFLPEVPAGTKVPVIADIGPYYSSSDSMVVQMEGDTIATEPAGRLGAFLIENFVPHGYAVAQVSVFGTGDSGHCQDLMGISEQAGVQAAVEWLGSQEWSNGNVGLIGRSYDGSTPWQAAMVESDHLKTIVPISGLIGVHELMWRNGSAESRGPGVLWALYQSMSVDGDMGDVENACKDVLQSPIAHLGAYATGDHFAPQANDFWAERYFLDAALANYKGSVYFIHGLQDWNVDPHMAFPTYQMLLDHGIETKGLFGQWDHAYPDRIDDHSDQDSGYGAEAVPLSVRHDWAQDLLEWFDHYLMGTGAKPALHVEVQDNMGNWRVEATYPPSDLEWVELDLADATYESTGPFPTVTPNDAVTFDFGALSDEDVRIAGLPQFHVDVIPTGPGGQLFVRMWDATTDLRLGHAVMDLRFHEGGRDMGTVTPGQQITALMEFEGLDVILPAGHELRVVVEATGEDYLPSAVTDPVLLVGGTFRLPTTVPEETDFFTPPGH